MYQSGYLESEIWQDGFVDPAVWYVEVVAPDITAGSYDSVALTITADGEGFRASRGSGDLFYRKDSGAWVAMSGYALWSSAQIVGNVPALANGVYDLKVVTDTAEEDILLNAFSVVPSASSTYWTDYNAVVDGSGTEASPWSLTQVKAYFNDDTGYFPLDGDIVMAKGDIVAGAGDAYVFLINVGDSKTIYLRAWGKSTNGMQTITVGREGIDIFSYEATNSDVRIVAEDLAIFTRDWPGPSSDPVVIVKTKSNAIAVNRFEFKDSMIISEHDVSMTGAAASEKVNVKILCSNLSFSNSQFAIDEYSNVSLIYDTVVNLVNGASISATGAPIWTNCETNAASGALPGSNVTCTFSNSSVERMATLMTSSSFYENDFNSGIYELTNTGSGVVFWTANGLTLDIKGYTRSGIGAMRFEQQTLYVDADKQIDGDGSYLDQFTFEQMRNYFNTAMGSPVGISPTGYDTFLLTGIFIPVDDFFLNIDEAIGGYTIIRCADILTQKAWFIETKDGSGTTFTLFDFGSSAYMKKLLINDFVLTENATTVTDVVTIDSTGIVGSINATIVEVRTSSYYCDAANIDFSSEDYKIALYGWGLTFRTDNTFRTFAEFNTTISLSNSVVSAGVLSSE